MAPKQEELLDSTQDNETLKSNTLKSSYHLLQRYSGTRKFFPNIFDWLEAKRRDDDVGDYWRVHDKLYNLESWIKRHPGGEDWIEMTRGTDITEAFEAYHVANVNLVERTLDKFYVADATKPRNSPYTFKEDGFYKTLKRKTEPILKKVGTDSSVEVKMMIDGLALLSLAFIVGAALYSSLWLGVLGGLALGLCTVAGHNFIHQKDSWRKYYLDLVLSSHEWRVSHGVSHHLFPNTVLDYEIQLGEPLMEFLPLREKSTFQAYGALLYVHIFYALYAHGEFLKRVILMARGKQKMRPENLLIVLEIFAIFWMSPTYSSAFKVTAIVSLIASYVFTINNHTTHHHPTSFHDGDEARSDPDFGICQVDASKSKVNWYHEPVFSVLTTFGDHPMHHLYPNVCVSKMVHIKPIVLETLKEFSESYPEAEQWEMFVGANKQMFRTESHPVEVYKSRRLTVDVKKDS